MAAKGPPRSYKSNCIIKMLFVVKHIINLCFCKFHDYQIEDKQLQNVATCFYIFILQSS